MNRRPSAEPEGSGGVSGPHRRDLAVAVDVLRLVLVVEAVAVVVLGPVRLARVVLRVRLGGVRVVCVDVEAWQDVERAVVDEFLDVGVVVVAGEQVPREVERAGHAVDLVAVNRAVHPHRGLRLGQPGLLGGDREHPLLAAHAALADRRDVGELAVLLLQPLHDLRLLGVAVVLLPIDRVVQLAVAAARARLEFLLRAGRSHPDAAREQHHGEHQQMLRSLYVRIVMLLGLLDDQVLDGGAAFLR
jgi:hypothetical protein